MKSVKMAFKFSVGRFVTFVREAAGYEQDKDGKTVVDDNGKPKWENARGNISFLFDGPAYESLSEASTECGGEENLLRIINDALAETCKNTAKEIIASDTAIPKTVTDAELTPEVRAAHIARLTAEAQSKVSAIRVVSLSSRGEKAATLAQLAEADRRVKAGESLSADETAKLISQMAQLFASK